MKNIFSIALLIVGLAFVGFLVSRMGTSESRYQRKNKSAWSTLSDGEDPTL